LYVLYGFRSYVCAGRCADGWQTINVALTWRGVYTTELEPTRSSTVEFCVIVRPRKERERSAAIPIGVGEGMAT
jgi:hypothetical protein